MVTNNKQQTSSNFIVTSIIFLGTILFSLAIFYAFPNLTPPSIDLIQYWSSAQLLLSNANPYDPTQISALQEPFHFSQGIIRIWNPPFIFPFILPFAFFEFSDLRIFWASLSLALFVSVAFLLLKDAKALNGSRSSRFFLYALLLTFTPLFETVNWGQISIVLLCAIAGWWLHYKKRGLESYSAGIFLGITVLKPHLFVFLYLFLFLSSLYERKYSLLIGFLTTIFVLTIIVLLIHNQIFLYYWHAFSEPPVYWRNPSLGSLLQALFPAASAWIRSIPMLIGIGILILMFLRAKSTPQCFGPATQHWSLLPISLALAPYGWIYDQVILLPFIIALFVFTQAGVFGKVGNYILALLVILQINIAYTPNSWGQESGLIPLLGYLFISVSIVLLRSLCRIK